jgi:hypothetical protein
MIVIIVIKIIILVKLAHGQCADVFLQVARHFCDGWKQTMLFALMLINNCVRTAVISSG